MDRSRRQAVDRLCHQEERRATSLSWPADVDARLNVLVRLAVSAGERTSRAEILAALVSTADVGQQALSDLLHSYRGLSAEALLDHNDRADLPTIRPSGRPRAPN